MSLACVPTGRMSERARALSGDGGEELGWGTRRAGQKVVAVEDLVGRDGVDLDGRSGEIQDRDSILSARAAAEFDDETRRLGHDGRDIATVVVVAAAAARHLLEMTDQLVDPAHAKEYAVLVPLGLKSFAPKNARA